jgi:putative hydrolase of the HAD superfamily
VTRAVFFDVDFTLIYPGPTFQAEGYRQACARYGIVVDATRFEAATAASAPMLDEADEQLYSHDLFIEYTASIIEHMGGRGEQVMDVAREIYEQWSVNHHFEMYDDVPAALQTIEQRGLIAGVISNSHRSLEAFCDHFALGRIITVSVSSAEHGYMKPHRSIFESALAKAGVNAAEALMVGDSLKHDAEGALSAGMRAVWLRRSGAALTPPPANVPVITTLADLDRHL